MEPWEGEEPGSSPIPVGAVSAQHLPASIRYRAFVDPTAEPRVGPISAFAINKKRRLDGLTPKDYATVQPLIQKLHDPLAIATRQFQTFQWFSVACTTQEIFQRFELDRRIGAPPTVAAVNQAIRRLVANGSSEALLNFAEDLVVSLCATSHQAAPSGAAFGTIPSPSTSPISPLSPVAQDAMGSMTVTAAETPLMLSTLLQLVQGLKHFPLRAARFALSLQSLLPVGPHSSSLSKMIPVGFWNAVALDLEAYAQGAPRPLDDDFIDLFHGVVKMHKERDAFDLRIAVAFGQCLLEAKNRLDMVVELVQTELLAPKQGSSGLPGAPSGASRMRHPAKTLVPAVQLKLSAFWSDVICRVCAMEVRRRLATSKLPALISLPTVADVFGFMDDMIRSAWTLDLAVSPRAFEALLVLCEAKGELARLLVVFVLMDAKSAVTLEACCLAAETLASSPTLAALAEEAIFHCPPSVFFAQLLHKNSALLLGSQQSGGPATNTATRRRYSLRLLEALCTLNVRARILPAAIDVFCCAATAAESATGHNGAGMGMGSGSAAHHGERNGMMIDCEPCVRAISALLSVSKAASGPDDLTRCTSPSVAADAAVAPFNATALYHLLQRGPSVGVPREAPDREMAALLTSTSGPAKLTVKGLEVKKMEDSKPPHSERSIRKESSNSVPQSGAVLLSELRARYHAPQVEASSMETYLRCCVGSSALTYCIVIDKSAAVELGRQQRYRALLLNMMRKYEKSTGARMLLSFSALLPSEQPSGDGIHQLPRVTDGDDTAAARELAADWLGQPAEPWFHVIPMSLWVQQRQHPPPFGPDGTASGAADPAVAAATAGMPPQSWRDTDDACAMFHTLRSALHHEKVTLLTSDRQCMATAASRGVKPLIFLADLMSRLRETGA